MVHHNTYAILAYGGTYTGNVLLLREYMLCRSQSVLNKNFDNISFRQKSWWEVLGCVPFRILLTHFYQFYRNNLNSESIPI